jgi:hypothetical protein
MHRVTLPVLGLFWIPCAGSSVSACQGLCCAQKPAAVLLLEQEEFVPLYESVAVMQFT